MAVREGIVPPITGCTEPRDTGTLSVTQTPLSWPENAPRRAAVSAMGFGGINTNATDPFHLRRVPISPWYSSPHEFGFDVAFGRTVLHA